MGSWGPGLYQDDEALDLKDTVALLSKLPVSGDRILEILLDSRDNGVGLEDDGGPGFWLVLADQFERKGIRCDRAFEQALAAVDQGFDLRDQEARDMTAADLERRHKALIALADRLRAPRPARRPRKARNPPDLVVQTGNVYAVPVMNGESFNPWHRDWAEIDFVPNGWSAMLILTCGRVYEWLPWCGYASLAVPYSSEPAVEDALKARILMQEYARIGVPRRSHLTRIGAKFLGRLELDDSHITRRIRYAASPEKAVHAGWSFTLRPALQPFELSTSVADLIAESDNGPRPIS